MLSSASRMKPGDAAMQDRVVEALFSAYFTQGLDVGDPGSSGQPCGRGWN
jgi:predicted DsbA family dithiol-disulfide isomerase